jgi:hypothetical protein
MTLLFLKLADVSGGSFGDCSTVTERRHDEFHANFDRFFKLRRLSMGIQFASNSNPTYS